MSKVENPVRLADRLANATAPVFGLFARRQFEIAAARRLSHSDFYTSYYPLFVFGLCLAFLSQVANLVSEYGYFEGILAVKLVGLPLAVAAGAAVGLLELAKYFVMNRVFADLFRLAGMRIPYGLAVVALAISGLSVWASIQGGGELARSPSEITQSTSDTDEQIAALTSEIGAIRKRTAANGWLPKHENAALKQKENLLAKMRETRASERASAIENEAANVQAYQYAFSGFELLFVICTLWAWYFRRRVAVEAESKYLPNVYDKGSTIDTPEQRTEPQQQHSQQLPTAFEPPHTARPIGFTYGNATANNEANHGERIDGERNTVNVGKQKECEHCGAVFVKKHWNARYCCDDCRIAAWEMRTGKTFTKTKK